MTEKRTPIISTAAGIVGTGMDGAATAYSLALSGLVGEIVFVISIGAGRRARLWI